MELLSIKGVGEKTKGLLNKLKIENVKDLIEYYPRNYDIYEPPVCIKDIDNKLVIAVEGVILKNPELKKVKNLDILSTVIRDDNNDRIKVTWFNMPYLKNQIKYSMRYIFRGRIKYINGVPVLEQPEIFQLGRYDEKLNSLQPLYSLTKGLTNNGISKIMKEAVMEYEFKDYLPESYRIKYNVCDYKWAIRKIHFPADFEELKVARKRLVFDEFFAFIYNMKRLKEKEIKLPNQYIINNYNVSSEVEGNLGFKLTKAQKTVLEDIKSDISSKYTMQRLIQGDVGSGKTIVAFLTMFDFANAGLQSAMMAPTEVLAEQHYNNICELIEKNSLDYEAVLLTGAVTGKNRKNIYEKIESGKALLIIGTHAIFQEAVNYNRLGLVIIDEQHRFGVIQRANLMAKGSVPHVMVMSATPIPRTLAIILYGDMDISVINELPANRLAIKNCVVTKEYRKNAYRFIEKEVANGHQAYVICPMVEESDTLEAENVIDYSEVLKANLNKNIKIEYLHGKMKPAQKNEILRRFEKNEVNVLVSTTVIEVGINVPNATIMMVENSERFGLSSLHQLRGRIGRGDAQGYCIFVSGTSNKDKIKKLEILNKSNDGFFIASEDLKLRGPGDFFGVRQSGDMQFQLADIYTDANVLKDVSKAVEEYMADGLEFIDKKFNDDIVIY